MGWYTFYTKLFGPMDVWKPISEYSIHVTSYPLTFLLTDRHNNVLRESSQVISISSNCVEIEGKDHELIVPCYNMTSLSQKKDILDKHKINVAFLTAPESSAYIQTIFSDYSNMKFHVILSDQNYINYCDLPNVIIHDEVSAETMASLLVGCHCIFSPYQSASTTAWAFSTGAQIVIPGQMIPAADRLEDVFLGREALIRTRNAIFKDAIYKLTSKTCTMLVPTISLEMFVHQIQNYTSPPYKIYCDNNDDRDVLRYLLGSQCREDTKRPTIVKLGHSLKQLEPCFEDFVLIIHAVGQPDENYTTCLVAKGYYIIMKSSVQSIWVNTRALFRNRDITPRPPQVDMFYYINLDYRTDRNRHMIKQFADHGIANFQRITAIKEAHGALGCSKSHVKTLETFLESGHQICVILEDDFVFCRECDFKSGFDKFFSEFPRDTTWDVVQLAANTLLSEPYNDCVDKCFSSLTTSGYMVNRRFAKTLLENFSEGIVKLESCRIHERRLYSLDVYWSRLQPFARWYVFKPKLGKQMESYSDVTNSVATYGV